MPVLQATIGIIPTGAFWAADEEMSVFKNADAVRLSGRRALIHSAGKVATAYNESCGLGSHLKSRFWRTRERSPKT